MEQQIRKTQEEQSIKDRLWISVLDFIVGELFGEEVLAEYRSYRFDEEAKDAGPGEELIAVELFDWEKRLWDVSRAANRFLRSHLDVVPQLTYELKTQLAGQFTDLFWAVIKMNHKGLNGGGICIRRNYRIHRMKGNAFLKDLIGIPDLGGR